MTERTHTCLNLDDLKLSREEFDDFFAFFCDYTDFQFLGLMDAVVFTRSSIKHVAGALRQDWTRLHKEVFAEDGQQALDRWAAIADSLLEQSPESEGLIFIEKGC